MTIDTSYQDQFPFLFAGNAGTIKITALANEAIPIIIESRKYAGTNVTEFFQASFTVAANERGIYELDLADILSSMSFAFNGAPNVGFGGLLGYDQRFMLRLGDDDEITWDKRVFFGTLSDLMLKNVYEHRCFMTIRSLVSFARIDGKPDYIMFAPSQTVISVVVYSDIMPPLMPVVGIKWSRDVGTYDVSFGNIRRVVNAAGYSELKITAYDIFLESQVADGNVTSTVKSETLRFIVPDRKFSMFEFLGSVGMLEPIYATGSRTSEVETETKTFVNDGVERELVNDSRLIHETFTGWLASADEVRFWQEFFSSAKRYAVVDGVSRRIVIDEVDSEGTEGELNAFSFKWHYADKHDDPSMVPIRKELKQYKI